MYLFELSVLYELSVLSALSALSTLEVVEGDIFMKVFGEN